MVGESSDTGRSLPHEIGNFPRTTLDSSADRSRHPVSSSARRFFAWEILIVLGLSLGQSAVYAVVRLVARLTDPIALSAQSTTLNASVSPRPWLDLTYQLLGIGFALVPVLLTLFLLGSGARSRVLCVVPDGDATTMSPSPAVANVGDGDTGDDLTTDASSASFALERTPESIPESVLAPVIPGARRIGLVGARGSRLIQLRDGLALAALIGIPGLIFYAIGRAAGITVSVQASGLNALWWTVPVLIVAAVKNALVEEIIVVGYLTERLEDLGWKRARILVVTSLLRGSYHLYQGIGPGIGNAVMGMIFGEYYRRSRRTWPLVIAHTVLDVVAFVGYALIPMSLLSHLGLS